MNTIEEISRICEEAGYVRLQLSSCPTWINSDKNEGIEVVGVGKRAQVRAFSIEDGERVRDKSISETTGQLFKKVIGESMERNGQKQEKEEEKAVTETKGAVEMRKDNAAIMPEQLTEAMMKDEKYSFRAVFLQAQITAPQHIKHRPGRGGKREYAYVDGRYVKQVLNLATKWRWSSKVDGFKETATEIICWGSISVNGPNGETLASQSAVGQADIKFSKADGKVVCLGDDYKAAFTDMIKKAASQWGVAADVYGGDYD